MKRTHKAPVQLSMLAAVLLTLSAVRAIAADLSAPGQCPQLRSTSTAPPEVYSMKNPLPLAAATIAAGERLYRGKPGSVSCATCHGERGDGKGALASQFAPPPRNFACAPTCKDIPDGQLFWIVKNGSPGTAMSAAGTLGKFSDEEIWQLVAYLRTLPR